MSYKKQVQNLLMFLLVAIVDEQLAVDFQIPRVVCCDAIELDGHIVSHSHILVKHVYI